jgi:hypothetical protein
MTQTLGMKHRRKGVTGWLRSQAAVERRETRVCWHGAGLAKAKLPLSCDDRPGAVEWGRVVVGCTGKMKARKTGSAAWDGLQAREEEKGWAS